MMSMEKTGVLLMAYGGPDNLEEVEPYLLDVRGGRPTPPALVEEIRERYARIGGRSPLLEVTRSQADALQSELNLRTAGDQHIQVYVGMRHWQPRIREAVAAMQSDGISRVVAIVMAPHYSLMSIEVYMKRLEEALQESGADIEVLPIRAWHNDPGFIEAVVEKAQAAMHLFEVEQPFIIFSAHSLPARIVEQGDPYPEQLEETSHLLAQALGLPNDRWQFSFQSAGRTGEPWLGPQIEQVVPELANRGEKNLLVVPVGFVADHVEVLFDIDIEAREAAMQYGARLERSQSLNASPRLIQALADLVFKQLEL
jgi:protoporphyrin/coproporphyrin ferrochelatase